MRLVEVQYLRSEMVAFAFTVTLLPMNSSTRYAELFPSVSVAQLRP